MTAGSSPPGCLRFGILARRGPLSAWQAQVVDALLAVDGVELACVVVDARPAPISTTRGRIGRLVRSPHAMWDTYNNGWVGRRAAALHRSEESDLLDSVPSIECAVDERGVSEYFPDHVVRQLLDMDLDFLLRFGFGIIRGDVLHSARHGVWSFHHDDEELYRGSPPAFWELVDDIPVSGAVLQRLTERLDGGQILEKGWFRTARHSYVRNTDTVHFGCVDWPAKVATRLLAGDTDAADPPVSPSIAPIFKKPSNATVGRFLSRQGRRYVAAQLYGLAYADQWEIGVVHAPIHRFCDPLFVPRVEWLALGRPPHTYAADPFVMEVDGEAHVLYERFEASRREGQIWMAPLRDAARARPAGLPLGAHASYPFCFETGGTRYCLPQVNGEPPRLYRLDRGDWHDAGQLIGHPVLDPTLVHWQDRWYLMATEPGRHALTKLHIWHAEDLAGPWLQHPQNPVVTDVRCARPAGTPFVHDGKLFRPAQDCANGYGSGVAICELVALSPTEFGQDVRVVHRPQRHWPFGHGMHTLAGFGDLTLLDARRPVLSRHETVAEIRGRLQRLKGSS